MRRTILGLAVAALAALAPAFGRADDQQIADFVRSRLAMEQQRGNLRGFNVDLRVENGTIWLSGHVSSPEMEQLVLSTAQQASHLGARQVVDDIEVRGKGVAQASVSQPVPMGSDMAQVAYQEPMGYGQAPVGPPTPAYGQPMQGFTGQPMAVPTQQVAAPMPLPAGYAGGNPAMASGSPNLPGYAWPSYAAYPNYAAVNYPQQYSASAWPYIGPFYPYPQVPLGWRKVQLEWDDGWWYLNFKDR